MREKKVDKRGETKLETESISNFHFKNSSTFDRHLISNA